MMARQPNFYDLLDRYAALSAADDPLERLAAVMDFEVDVEAMLTAIIEKEVFAQRLSLALFFAQRNCYLRGATRKFVESG